MLKKNQSVYQFKITLIEIKPEIWRRIQVPKDYSFWDLHVAIQDAMGWQDYHLHEFLVLNPKEGMEERIGIPDQDFVDDTFPGWNIKIKDYFSDDNAQALYEYDFGDSWVHTILFEKDLPAEPNVQYPKCLNGKRACPPEDCGGPWGYQDFMKSFKNKNHDSYQDNLEFFKWYDPEAFQADSVKFDNPEKRWQDAFSDQT